METLIYSFLLSMAPIAELRGGIPYAMLNDVHPITAYILCCFANILVFPFGIFFLESFHKYFMKIAFYENIFDKLVVRTQKKTGHLIEKYGFWGLMIFVMIPLPVTGAYTGTFAAWLFQVKKRKAFMAVSLGVLIAGVIITTVVLTGSSLASIFTKEL